MSVYKGKGRATYQYDFWYHGKRYKDTTHQTTEEAAVLVEAKLKLELRQKRGGIALPGPSPSITAWAGVYYTWCEIQRRRVGRPKRLDVIDVQLRVVLRFFGSRPSDSALLPAAGEEAPFHDLTLQDLIDEPQWIEDFQAWIDRRNVAGGTRNHYLSRMSCLYTLAMSNAHRKTTGITFNPFEKIERAPKVHRKVALTPDLVVKWIGAMSYHTRLAVAIAALAPKLRLANVLELDRHRDIDQAVTKITVGGASTKSGQPLEVPISGQLRDIFLDAFARMRPPCTRVVQFRGSPIKSVRHGIAAAARDAAIPYGRFTAGGVTFHTLRHTASTLFAALGINPWLHRDAMGHADLSTTEGYTHLQIEAQRPAHEQLSAILPIGVAVMRPGRRPPARTRPGSSTGLARVAVGGKLGEMRSATVQKPQQIREVTRGALQLAGRRFARKG